MFVDERKYFQILVLLNLLSTCPEQVLSGTEEKWGKKGNHFFYPVPKKVFTSLGKPCSGHDQKKLFKEKSAFAQIIKGGNIILGDFLG